MNGRTSPWLRSLFVLAACLAAVLGFGHAAAQQGIDEITLDNVAPTTSFVGPDGRAAFFVELEGLPAAKVYANVLAEAGSNSPTAQASAAAAAREQTQRNLAAQEQVAAQLLGGSFAGEEIYRVQKVLNGIAVRLQPSRAVAARHLAGVKRVHVMIPESPTNSTSVPFIGAPPVWGNTVGLPFPATGQGVKIGIIDTGIDYIHANFGGTGLLADYQANDRTVAPDGFFPNAKVVGGTDFAGDNYNAVGNGGSTGTTVPSPDPDPMDCNTHGTHVSGTAAGFGVNADGSTYAGPWNTSTPFGSLRLGPGVAPQASLYGLRVFGCQGSTNLTVQAIEWAADPNNDNDFSDHLDVINMSLGSNFGTISSTSSEAAENAAEVGVIVAAASGNAGDIYFITSSPGVASRAISVAASVDSGVPGALLTVNSPGAIAGGYAAAASGYTDPTPPPPPVPANQTGNLVAAIDPADGAGPLTTDGCTAFTNAAAVAGNIALIDRGTCGFTVKVLNAQAAGAIGVVIANNAADPVPAVMGGAAAADINIVGISISQATGTLLRNQLISSPVNITVTAASAADTVATFSSRGPRRASSPVKLKPEIAAPGQTITSSLSGTSFAGGTCVPNCNVTFNPGSLTLNNNGTSMATPHIAGTLAVLRQLHPDWTVEEMKALVMNYALHDTTLGANASGPRYTPSRVGAGRVDVTLAAQGQVLAMSDDDEGLVSVSFESEVVGNVTRTHNVRVVNHGTTAQTYDLALDTVMDAPGVAFSLPGGSTVTVPAGGSTVFQVQMSANASQMDHASDPTSATVQTAAGAIASLGNLPRHWLTEEQAYLRFSQSGNLKLRLPVYMANRPASTMAAADTIATGGAPTGSTTIALTGGEVCTGTLGAGPTCTGTFPNDEVSLVTPFELQLTSPRVNEASEAFGDIQYAGAAFSSAAGVYMFGISAYGEWSTPTDVAFDVCVDTDENGTYDRVVFNSNTGAISTLLGTAANGQDLFVNAIFNTATNGVTLGGASVFTNRASAAVVDSALFLNNVMFLAVTPGQLGLTAGDTSFRYKVVACPGFNPLCVRTNACAPAAGSFFDQTAGFAFWSSGAQGLDFGGTNLAQDLNGASLPVTWNTANMTTNGSLGALLLHHHNANGRRAEVVLLQGTTGADLALTKGMAPAAPNLGDDATFTLTVTNNGPAAATGVSVFDLLPAGLAYVSDNGAGAYNAGTGVWTVGNLAVSASASLQIVATVETTDPVENLAQISASSPLDPNSANNESKVVVNAPEVADLDLGMTVSSPTVLVGGNVTFNLTVTNNGSVLPSALHNTAFSIAVNELFPGFEPLSPTTSTPSDGVYNGTTGIWNLASLGDGASATLALTFVAPNMAGPLTNNGTASSSIADNDNANNAASASVTVLSPATITATKTVAGTFNVGGTVTYTVVLSNSSAFAQQNNPGNEFSDVLPGQVTLVSATATSGTAVATVGTNTVTWNGSVPGNGSVTITITATVDAGTEGQTASNLGSISSDADGNGVNEATGSTDDPTVGGANDPTTFVIVSPSAIGATKTVSGTFVAGGSVTYTITLNNSGLAQLDNPGDEFTDTLPSELMLVSATATSGAAVADLGTNTVTWNGPIPAGGTVTITIEAVIGSGLGNVAVSNQGTVSFDADGNGTNESSVQTDDPAEAGDADATVFQVGGTSEIPTLSEVGLAFLGLLLAGAALVILRRRAA